MARVKGGGWCGVGVKQRNLMLVSFLVLTLTPALFVVKISATTKSKETDKHIQMMKMKIKTLTGNLFLFLLLFLYEGIHCCWNVGKRKKEASSGLILKSRKKREREVLNVFIFLSHSTDFAIKRSLFLHQLRSLPCQRVRLASSLKQSFP